MLRARGTPVAVETVEIPEPGSGELLVRIYACGVCHTDVHAIDGDWPAKSILPLVPGHEGVGIIVKKGENCSSRLNLGDHVGIPWLCSSCQACEYCISGWETLCTTQLNAGFSTHGCLREYTVVPHTNAILLPPDMPFEQAAPLLCAGVTSYKALKESEARAGEFVAIIGAAGGLGHLAVQYAVAMGLRVLAVDTDADKLAFARSLGAEHALLAGSAQLVADAMQLTGGGCHAVLCLAPHPLAFAAAVDLCRRKGTMVCVALPAGCFPCPIFDIVLKRITVRGSIVGTRKDMQEALDIAYRGLVKCNVELAVLEDLNDVVQRLKQGRVAGRVVVKLVSDHDAVK